jgi:cytochrome c oxidase subunit 2
LRGHLGLEIGWTVAPAIIVVAIAIPTIRAVFATQRPASDDALIVEVTGHRFWWEFSYPELGVRTANELHLPVGRPVSLRLSARDVVHSFWVPALGGKRDVAPFVAVREGEDPRYTWLHFTPSVPGVYMGQCAEYCGEAHALMGIRVLVETEDDFGAWTSGWLAGDAGPAPPLQDAEAQQPIDQPPETTPQPPDATVQGDPAQLPGAAGQAGTGQPSELDTESALAAAGRDVFLTQSTCTACHAIGGTPAQGRVGPDLTLFGNRTTLGAGLLENTPENIARWIRDPQGLKPGAEMPGTDYALEGGTGQVPTWPATGLDEEQVAAVAAYLHSLR